MFWILFDMFVNEYAVRSAFSIFFCKIFIYVLRWENVTALHGNVRSLDRLFTIRKFRKFVLAVTGSKL